MHIKSLYTLSHMTSKAGLAGLISGLIATTISYLVMSDAGLFPSVFTLLILLADLLLVLAVASGFLACRWCKSTQPGRCIALGGFTGVIAAVILFCLWGAAAAGKAHLSGLSRADMVPMIVKHTVDTFMILFVAGGLAGCAGGWLSSSRRWKTRDEFDMSEPQMAMNASITALPASIVAAGVAAAVFPRLAMLTGYSTGLPGAVHINAANIPLEAALFIVLVAHLAVTLVVPHETRQSQHLCGMDEVKMAAFVGIGAAPLLIIILLVVNPGCFSQTRVLISILASVIMSMFSIYSLVRMVLPKRASFPPHPVGSQKAEAVLFGSIASSIASRLVVLCIGCGLMMVLPLYVSVISILVNLNFMVSPSSLPVNIYAAQAIVSIGLMTTSSVILILIYMVYLNLGRWFNKRMEARG
jgi:hypothetical protein